MKVIELKTVKDVEKIDALKQTLVLGYFDGVHLGHQFVIANGRKIANTHSELLAVMSFDQSPRQFFNPDSIGYSLTTRQQKIKQLEKLGVDIFYIVSFTQEFSRLSPNQFIDQYLVPLCAKHIVTGFDYRFGKHASGDIYTLKALEKGRFKVSEIDSVELNHEKISSTVIRHALLAGDLPKANQLLGRAYQIDGIVIHGDARGRTIGFPTANIEWNKEQLLLMEGVYAVQIKVHQKWYQGMASIGRNITFEKNRHVSIEVNIFEFNEMIYGQNVSIKWYKRLRKEIKFNHIEGLIRQLNQDKYEVKQFFSKEMPYLHKNI
ncbi:MULTISPECIES: riboflavin biosynthesis protein RibF [unclassified Granulicatella]|uniref:riboflavin biosynthesis protein RibF n=1 Tax=unclassified Granulicatella TaxID=2630493 RepID=UPI001073D6EF|nr:MULTISPECIES: riboflavin biosynthesis protein RibF [unclassified Granulicatella]MBF0779727.1 riboflavin biosynthesis protein RibF [Granulicatella sp. 19428wC4_WM01]TFU96247.1 riboflavin biosynthesis protein RibF [Granulicatella sp. WM01]